MKPLIEDSFKYYDNLSSTLRYFSASLTLFFNNCFVGEGVWRDMCPPSLISPLLPTLLLTALSTGVCFDFPTNIIVLSTLYATNKALLWQKFVLMCY